ncbi:MAG: OmpA family protein [Spirochaetia bacterium]|nr:OmpA family protein [Spirochaetia bacterium]
MGVKKTAALALAVFMMLAVSQGCKKTKVVVQPTPVPTATTIPNLQKIVYTFNGNLFWMDTTGESRQEIFADNSSKWFPSVSPDGLYIAYWVQTRNNYNLWVGDLMKKRSFQVMFDNIQVDSDFQNFNFQHPVSWSQDSASIYYSRGGDIWRMTRDGYNMVALTETHDSFSPAISKDNKLVFVVKESDDTYNLYIRDLNSLRAERLTKHSGKKTGSPRFSPDGVKIVYTLTEDDSVNIRLIDINSKADDILTFDGKSNCPAFSNDGKKILYSSYINDKYQPDIWIMNTDKSGRMKLTKDGGVSPCWLYRTLSSPLPTYTPTPVPGAAPARQQEIFNIKESQPTPGEASKTVPVTDFGDLTVRTVVSGDKLLFYPVILYDSARITIKSEFFRVLDDMALIMKGSLDPIVIEGHTDNIPINTQQYPSNHELSLARANAVKRYLIEHHAIDSGRITTTGFGETRPMYPNDTEENRYKNRRSEVMVIRIGQTAAAPAVLPATDGAVPAISPTIVPTAAPVKINVKGKSGKKSAVW